MSKRSFSRIGWQQGVALVIVLWVVSLLALIAGSFALTMRRDTSVAVALTSNARAQACAEAGLAYAQFMLTQPDAKLRWRDNGTVYSLPQTWGELRIAIYAESGKVDLNASSEQQLAAILTNLIENESQRQQLVDAIMDWRDADDEPRPSGAERKQYQQNGAQHIPTNQAFQSLEELQQVLGVTPELYSQLEPMITVYSGSERVDLQKASPKIISALQQDLQLRQIHDEVFNKQLQQIDSQEQDDAGEVLVINDQAYTIISEAQLNDVGKASLQAVVKSQTDASAVLPFKFLDWKVNTQRLSLFAETMDAPIITLQNEFTNDD